MRQKNFYLKVSIKIANCTKFKLRKSSSKIGDKSYTFFFDVCYNRRHAMSAQVEDFAISKHN